MAIIIISIMVIVLYCVIINKCGMQCECLILLEIFIYIFVLIKIIGFKACFINTLDANQNVDRVTEIFCRCLFMNIIKFAAFVVQYYKV